MKRRMFVTIIAVLVFAGAAPFAQRAGSDEQTIEDIREAMLRLPYYGVFDSLSFEYDKGTVTLSGYVFQPSLKGKVVNAVKRVRRVDEVVDKIEELPTSHNDDRIRWQTFYQIYNDSSLSRYASGGGVSRFDLESSRFPGMQPFGTYGIQIIVKGGRTRLLGVVDSQFDKTIAGVRAREVPGTFGVENDLVVTGSGRSR
jgi:hyperosmotically inducible periplasmic protein